MIQFEPSQKKNRFWKIPKPYYETDQRLEASEDRDDINE